MILFLFVQMQWKALSERNDFFKAAPCLCTFGEGREEGRRYLSSPHVMESATLKNNPLLQRGERTNEYWSITLLQFDPHYTQINIHKPP